jgi:hypothetical protein
MKNKDSLLKSLHGKSRFQDSINNYSKVNNLLKNFYNKFFNPGYLFSAIIN